MALSFETPDTSPAPPATPARRPHWVFDLLLIVALLAGAYFRSVGLYWGEYQYLHPDERFLVWVGSDITPLKCQIPDVTIDQCPQDQQTWMGMGEYFDAAKSTLNPANRGHPFYVYGTLPMFAARYVVQWIFGHSGWDVMIQVGRALSALADLLAVYLVYLTAARLYDRRVGVLAAAFSAAVVLQIQQAHFFTMDTFMGFFSLLAFYFAVRVMTDERTWSTGAPALEPSLSSFYRHPLFWPSLGFGVALGCAVASKLSTFPMAAALPVALGVAILRLPRAEREAKLIPAVVYLVLAALTSIVIFRLFQPYAFSGPSIFGILPNDQWVEAIQTQRDQAGPDVDMPPAMQWARRPLWFSFQNLTVWGLGLPLGILAWVGFLYAGWRMLKGEWAQHALLWSWTGLYFGWQSLALNPTMRYQLPVYPMLTIFAAWFVITLWDGASPLWDRSARVRGAPLRGARPRRNPSVWQRGAALLLGVVVLVSTYAYAYAFTRQYVQRMTRIASSQWIYDNIPGPINLPVMADGAVHNQILPFSYDYLITPGIPYQVPFVAKTSGVISEVYLRHVLDTQATGQPLDLRLSISITPGGLEPLAVAETSAVFPSEADALSPGVTMALNQPVTLIAGNTYYLRLELAGEPVSPLTGTLEVQIEQSADGSLLAQPVPDPVVVTDPNLPFSTYLEPDATGLLTQVTLSGLTGGPFNALPQTLRLSVQVPGELEEPLVTAVEVQDDPGGRRWLLNLIDPLPVNQGELYRMSISLQPQGGAITLLGSGIASEGDWDDNQPVRLDGYDGYGGIYQLDQTFNMYWDDTPEKLARFLRILDESEYVTISSNRQWGSLPRIPERFPMTTLYYRSLLGCPEDQTIEWCYNVAEPGQFQGELGFELVEVFTSNPTLGPIELNDQFAEEAFTVYDHPKVFIFRKTEAYDAERVAALLGSIDFSQVVRVPPMRAGATPTNLMLSVEQWAKQQAGGTWAELFDRTSFVNSSEAVSAAVWYLALMALGLAAYPLVRAALPGLSDHGYPLARTAGLLILAYTAWLGGSLGAPFTRPVILILLGLLAAAGLLAGYFQRQTLRASWRGNRRYFLIVEGLFLAFFVLDLLIRINNPDLWHPWKGGEKPMDFAYFNAVLKSTSFPPYDPWFAGGYLNYYYFGFVFMGVLVKGLGIMPSVAYNLILPSLFAMIALGAFSLSWNLYTAGRRRLGGGHPERGHNAGGTGSAEDGDSSLMREDAGATGDSGESPIESALFSAAREDAGATGDSGGGATTPSGDGDSGGRGTTPLGDGDSAVEGRRFVVALAGAVGMAVLGNLGVPKMFVDGWQRLAAPGGVVEGAGMFTRWVWGFRGFFIDLTGGQLPYRTDEYYWNPSRVIPGQGDIEPITEFPFFTVLYGDPHAHLFALPITLLALAFVASLVLNRGRWRSWAGALGSLLLGALAIGALRPTNTWDLPTYLALAGVAVVYTLWRYRGPARLWLRRLPGLKELPETVRRVLIVLAGAGVLLGLTILLFQPYARWYSLGYTEIDPWKGSHTPLSSYLYHWGLFLFVIVAWMIWETRDWLDSTPVSAVHRLARYKNALLAGVFVMLAAILFLLWRKVHIAPLVIPLMVWAGLLLLRPRLADARRLVLFLVGTGLALTLFVELFVLVGDIGRMNTVFKFYLQVWTLFSISAAASLGWLLMALPGWLPGWRRAFQGGLAVLVFGAALFPLMGGLAKIRDRMVPDAPRTLDGMTYMNYAAYDYPGPMDLSEDYRAIQWLQDNVSGSPVLIEASQLGQYYWGSRISIYTGLPTVAGWEWHQQQQRVVVPGSPISTRIAEVQGFYTTTDLEAARSFLQKYGVQFIIVGQLERNYYPGEGLNKFPQWVGILWEEVYRDGDTAIYQVK